MPEPSMPERSMPDRSMPVFGAIILSAGFSSRMQGFKPLYSLGETTALAGLIASFREAGVGDIVVVTGHRGDEVAAEAARSGARTVHNPEFAQGMFTSVTAGVRAAGRQWDGFFINPVDIPLIRTATVRRLMDNYRDDMDVLHPVFAGERGHPPLIHARMRSVILNWDGRQGLRGCLEQAEADCPECTSEILVPDRFILEDMDTEEDYTRLKNTRRDLPTEEECAAALEMIGTPERTVRHCRAVSLVALEFAENINRRRNGDSPALDLKRIERAALLHDIAKGERHHEQVGGRMLDELGFTSISPIVAVHRDIPLPENLGAPLTEAEVVFMADKVTAGTEIVPVAERYGRVLEYHGHDPDARQAIERRRGNALAMEQRFEAQTGAGLEEQAASALKALGPE